MAKKIDSKIPAGPVPEKWKEYKAHQRLVNPKNKLKLAMMTPEDGFPIALGVIRDVDAPTYNDAVHAQLAEVSAQKKYHNFEELLETNDIWEVK